MKCAYPGCDVEFVPRVGGRPQRFCSPEHSSGGRKLRYWKKNRERILEQRKLKFSPPPEKQCERDGCLNTFVPVNRRDQKYCSEQCREKVHRTTPQYRAKAARSQAQRAALPTRQAYMRTYRRRGMADESFVAMWTAQGGRCAICQESPDELVLDHNHATQTNRALLCRPCNLGLGHFKDDPAVMESAIKYLKGHLPLEVTV